MYVGVIRLEPHKSLHHPIMKIIPFHPTDQSLNVSHLDNDSVSSEIVMAECKSNIPTHDRPSGIYHIFTHQRFIQILNFNQE